MLDKETYEQMKRLLQDLSDISRKERHLTQKGRLPSPCLYCFLIIIQTVFSAFGVFMFA